MPLPLIVSFGGINPAGRSSFHHAYRRMVADRLDEPSRQQSYTDLALLMGLLRYSGGRYLDSAGAAVELSAWLEAHRSYIDQHTLIRKLEDNLFDPDRIPKHVTAAISAASGEPLSFRIRTKDLPDRIPLHWQLEHLGDGMTQVRVNGQLELLLPDSYSSGVNSAGQLPTGFEPQQLYASRNHPRGLQLCVFGASDALQSLGLPWQAISARLTPDQIGVYASSAMGQLDRNGNAGLLQARLQGKRVTSKQLALAFTEMPGDFINAYIAGNLGGTGGVVGACATFLYNLAQAINEIRAGRKRLAIVGSSEAPITAEIIDGYRTMGALADDDGLRALDPHTAGVDYRRACRPFSNNCGFTLSESAQFVVVCDDQLALELGANIHAGVADVFINADGYKKSISGPGVGNYITMAKAAAMLRAVLGQEGLQRSYVQAHGTSTPQNRVTESHILSETAKAFGIKDWRVTAIKAYLGHSIGAAGGDQLAASLGVWRYGLIPGIHSIDHLAEDVHREGLRFLTQHEEVGAEGMDAVILNSKGFGGNNASAAILAPHSVASMLQRRHGAKAMTAYAKRNEPVKLAAAEYDEAFRRGEIKPVYQFDFGVKDAQDVQLSDRELRIEGYQGIGLELENPYL